MQAVVNDGMPRLAPGMTPNELLCDELFRLGDPALDAAGKSDFLADLLGVRIVQLGKLRVVEHAEIVELLLDRARHARQLLQIVGDAARPGNGWKPVAGASAGTSSATGASAAPISTPRSRCEREMPSIAAFATRSQ